MKKQWLKYQVLLCRNNNKPSLNAKNGGGINIFYWFYLPILYVLLFSTGYTVEMSNYWKKEITLIISCLAWSRLKKVTPPPAVRKHVWIQHRLQFMKLYSQARMRKCSDLNGAVFVRKPLPSYLHVHRLGSQASDSCFLDFRKLDTKKKIWNTKTC